ncbi:MAG: hypothetical protein QNJ11_07280 [Woeseiaceae bacterium]|nr:hypothetical protein [Woeseiaceae bacterium]
MLSISTINVTGTDALEFLQGQLTNDLQRLESEPEILAAWCTPKGRVIWFGTVTKADGGYALSVPRDRAETIVARLTMFRFRSKVDFNIVDEGQTVDPELLVERGHPYIGAEQAEGFTPHMLNLDLLDAISLDKGCYTGQEIVARTHYKGATKRRTLRFSSAGPVKVGDKVMAAERSIGEVLNVAGNELLAVVPVDQSEAELSVGGIKLERRELTYLNLGAGHPI